LFVWFREGYFNKFIVLKTIVKFPPIEKTPKKTEEFENTDFIKKIKTLYVRKRKMWQNLNFVKSKTIQRLKSSKMKYYESLNPPRPWKNSYRPFRCFKNNSWLTLIAILPPQWILKNTFPVIHLTPSPYQSSTSMIRIKFQTKISSRKVLKIFKSSLVNFAALPKKRVESNHYNNRF